MYTQGLDGQPVDAAVPMDFVLEIAVPDEAIVERMSGRRVHPASGNPSRVT